MTTVKLVTVRDVRDRAGEMFRSDDVILVTRDGAPAGFYLPWDTPDLPVQVRREVFLRLSEQIAYTSPSKAANNRSSTISLPAAVVGDANVVLSPLIGGRARLVITSPHPPRCVAAEPVALEIARHIPRLATQRHLGPAPLLAALQVMPIEWKPAADYDPAPRPRRAADRHPRPRRLANRRARWLVAAGGRVKACG